MKSHTNSHAHAGLAPSQNLTFTSFIVFVALLAALSISGCVGLTNAGPPATNSNSSGASGSLAANATSLSFGNVAPGANSSQTLTLTNTGTATLTISQATITGASFSVVGGMTSVSIPGGQSHAFQIKFAPQAAGNATGSMTIVTDANHSPLSVSLSGMGMMTVSISAQPASQSVTTGNTATFSVGATGTGTLTYQWKKNGTAVGGATGSSYVTPATVSSDNGASFTVVVTDNTGSVTSNAATLSVTAAPVAPSITVQPVNQTATAGQTATFTVGAAGTATLAYQWKKNGTPISGATSSAYTTPATAASDNGASFAVTVTNSVGNVTSNAATLTVNVPPTITTQPVNQSVTAGQTATFSAAATGTGSLAYQWKKNGSAISGATSPSYTTPATSTSDNGGVFTVSVTSSVGSVTSNAATLTVTAAPVAPSITTQPVNQTVNAGQTATFVVAANGTATLTYQWKRNGVAISGANAPSYTTPTTLASDSGASFAVSVTNSLGTATSNAATLTVNVPPAITTQPVSQTITAGQTATFTVAATGTGTIAYQWKKNGSAISGATSASYTTPASVAGDNGASFTVTVTDSITNVTSNAAILTVNAPPAITAQPVNQTMNAGQTATFNVAATGTGTLTYQWKKNGTAISGAAASSYTTPATSASDNGSAFTVTVTNSVGSADSNAAMLTVNVPPSITTQPVSQTVTAGQTATFTVAATGTGTLTYQWKKNGASISGATAASYTTPATTASDNSASFTVTVANGVTNVTSNGATLTVNMPPAITTQPANQTVLSGHTATFTAVATGTGSLNYQWNKNGAAISGATGSAYTTPVTTSADNGAQFTVTVTNSTGNVTSNAAMLTVNAATFLLNASTTSLDFGTVNTGSHSILGITFNNAGNSDVTVSGVSISGAGYTAGGVSTGQIITPGQTVTLNVTFTPASTGNLPGSVTVTSNATNSLGAISLSGAGAQQVSHSVTLSWTASTSTVFGYNVYQATVSGGPYTKLDSSWIPSTSYLDSTVQSGQTYYYVVTSVNPSGVESAFSTQVSAVIP